MKTLHQFQLHNRNFFKVDLKFTIMFFYGYGIKFEWLENNQMFLYVVFLAWWEHDEFTLTKLWLVGMQLPEKYKKIFDVISELALRSHFY